VARSYFNDRLPDIPMIVGYCLDETKGMFGNKGNTPSYKEFLEFANVYGDKKDEFLKIANVSDDAGVAELYERGDFNSISAGSRGFCELRSAMGKKVYLYIFDHDIPGDDAGSFHGSDLWFTFDSLSKSWRPFEGKHYDLARQVCSYWTNFVKFGDPNGDGTDYNGNPLPEWRPYTKNEKNVMMFYDKATPETLPENAIIDFRLEFAKDKFTDK
ncbi:MAG: carboxylesterase family protein, partial [Clostridiaceae bacterium]|nr:carboxylesterase family protein [Clostridiaceae bacterium]